VTNEGCWKAVNDNLRPNPPFDPDILEEQREEIAKAQNHDTKVIMAHEFREDPEGFKALTKAVVDSYNEEHTLVAGGELPEQLETKPKKEWVFDPLTGYKYKEKEDE
jgi:hypothetical protein